MKKANFYSGMLLLFMMSGVLSARAQSVPELFWYKFDQIGTSVTNYASTPPPGTGTATILGGQSQGNFGLCGGALIGSGNSSSTDYVNTGWATSLSGSWTLSFWTKDITPSATLFYIFGDGSAGSFRCFTNGVAGPSNWLLRGTGIIDVLVSGAAIVAPTMTTFVYDVSLGNIKAYVNGLLVNTVAQSPLTISGSGPFKVGAYATSTGLPANGLMDEFRIYNRALSDPEILSLLNPYTTSVISPNLCGQYVSPSGNYTWNTTGTYNDTIPNVEGCDSVITINLTILPSTSSATVVSVCDSYTSPSGNYNWTSSGIYNDTIPNIAGCDSVITFDLTIVQSSNGTAVVAACDSYTAPSGNNTWTASGIYNDTIPNMAGCDSIIVIDLTVLQSSNGNANISSCFSYTSPSGNFTWNSSGVYADTITNLAGCDSIISISLNIDTVNTLVTLAGITLTATDSTATYQWLDCDSSFQIISGETAQSFTPIINGNYAVEITNGICVDTSACFNITTVGIRENSGGIQLHLEPNPNNGQFIVRTSGIAERIEVLNLLGNKLFAVQPVTEVVKIDLGDIATGVYFVRVIGPTGMKTLRFIVDR